MSKVNAHLLLAPILLNPQGGVPPAIAKPVAIQGGQDEVQAQACFRQFVPLLATGRVEDFQRAVAAYRGLKRSSPKAPTTQQFATEISRAFVNQVNQGVDLTLTGKNRSQVLAKTAGMLSAFGSSLEDEGVKELLANMELDVSRGADFRRYFTAVHFIQVLMPISDTRLRAYLYLGNPETLKLLGQAAPGSETGRGLEMIQAIDRELNGFNPANGDTGEEVAANHMDLARLWAARVDFAHALQDGPSVAQCAQQAMGNVISAQNALEIMAKEEKDPEKRRTLWKKLADNSLEGIALANRLGSLAMLPGFWGKVLDAQAQLGRDQGSVAKLQNFLTHLQENQGLTNLPSAEKYYPLTVNLLTALMHRDDPAKAEESLQAALATKQGLTDAVEKAEISPHDFVETASGIFLASAKVCKEAMQDDLAQKMRAGLDDFLQTVREPLAQVDQIDSHFQILDLDLTRSIQLHLAGEDPTASLQAGFKEGVDFLLDDLEQGKLTLDHPTFQALLGAWINHLQIYFRATDPPRLEAYEILNGSLQTLLGKALEKADALTVEEEKFYTLGMIAEIQISAATDLAKQTQAAADALRQYSQALEIETKKKDLRVEERAKIQALTQKVGQLNLLVSKLRASQSAGGK